MKISTTPYSAHQLVKLFSQQIGASCKTDCLEVVLRIPQKYGKGILRGFEFSDGISLILLDCVLKDDLTILFERSIPPIQFNFSVKGGIKHFYNSGSIQYFLNPLQGTITSDLIDCENGFQFPGNQEVTFACLMIEREQYLKKIDCILEKMPPKLQSVFTDSNAKTAFFYQGNYSITSSECIQTILTDEHTGLVRSTYLEGVTLELFSGQIKQFKDDLATLGKQVTIRKQDVEKILEAKEILLKDFQNPPTIKELAKLVAINESKLKSGFKKVFDLPIKTWLRNKRLEMAKLLLLEESRGVGAIAEAIGYTNRSHFARRFKEKFGVLPKDYAQTIRDKFIHIE